MITFSPNDEQMIVNDEQMRTIMHLIGSDKAGEYEVVELETNGALELYVGNAFRVGDEYHRYYIDIEGTALPAEYCTVTKNETDWSWDW